MRPSRISRDATNRTVLLAIAKQSPCAGRITAVFTPITSPRVVTSGPPEFPGLSAASDVAVDVLADELRAVTRSVHQRRVEPPRGVRDVVLVRIMPSG